MTMSAILAYPVRYRSATAVIVAMAANAGFGSPQTVPAAAPPDRVASSAIATPDWKSDATLSDKLSAPQMFGTLTLRPPLGYRPQVGRTPNHEIVARAWVGDAREDRTRPYISLRAVPKGDASTAARLTPARVLTNFEADVKRKRTQWQETPIEYGAIGGMAAVRAHWTGTDTANGAKMAGFGYVLAVPEGFVYISSQDVEPYTKTALPLAEAAALTVRRS